MLWNNVSLFLQQLENYSGVLDLDLSFMLISGICKHLILLLLLDGSNTILFNVFSHFVPCKNVKASLELVPSAFGTREI